MSRHDCAIISFAPVGKRGVGITTGWNINMWRADMDMNGKYEIIEMELWDKKDIDLVQTGYVEISGTKGGFHFICMES